MVSEPLFWREVEVVPLDAEASAWFVELHAARENANINRSKDKAIDLFIVE